ncbi:MAG: hypothetical protein HY815_08520 [Candidatus Riflebacteria bacterium]|nr:hypothetical protein [Candidatus Riflebacteria bacterium]
MLFLEFALTLPVFALIIITATAFHVYFKHTRLMYGHARQGVWVLIDRHMSSLDPASYNLSNFTSKPLFTVDGLAASDPAVTHIPVISFQATASRQVDAPSWMGAGEAVGFCWATRDGWAHRDIETRLPLGSDRPVESMPYVFHEPNASGPVVKEFLRL